MEHETETDTLCYNIPLCGLTFSQFSVSCHITLMQERHSDWISSSIYWCLSQRTWSRCHFSHHSYWNTHHLNFVTEAPVPTINSHLSIDMFLLLYLSIIMVNWVWAVFSYMPQSMAGNELHHVGHSCRSICLRYVSPLL